jgi:putative membrane protein
MRRLHPATILVCLFPRLREVLQAAVPIIIGSFASGRGDQFDLILTGIGLFGGVFAISTYWTTRFEIEPDHVVWHSGLIFRRDRRIPLEHVHNVNLHQNVLERMLKVASVEVETAAGTGPELKLRVLALPEAERFREELLGAARLERSEAGELGAAGERKIEEPLVRLTNRELLLGATSENHWLNLFLMAAPGGSLISVLLHKGAFNEAFSAMPRWAMFVISAGAFAAFLLAGWVWGAIGYILKYGGFIVRRDGASYRISYGLLAKVQMAIRPSRIEYVCLTTTLPQRWIARTALFAGTAGSFGEAGTLAPMGLMLPRHVAFESVSDVVPGVEVAKLPWRAFHPVFYRATVVRSLVMFLIWAGIATFGWTAAQAPLGAMIGVGMGLVALFPLVRLAMIFLSRAETSFAITDDVVAVRRGYYHQKIEVVPIDRLEFISTSQPLWWKGRQATSLCVQGMKHVIRIEGLPESAVEELRGIWGRRILARATKPEAAGVSFGNLAEDVKVVALNSPIAEGASV